jgi:hypothetical protein
VNASQRQAETAGAEVEKGEGENERPGFDRSRHFVANNAICIGDIVLVCDLGLYDKNNINDSTPLH